MRYAPVVLLLAACTDYNLQGDPSLYANPNPPDLSAPVQDDVITQVTVAKVDVLWCVDDSGSMSEEQASLTSNFANFMQYFLDSGLDYHVGVVSTDMQANGPGNRGHLNEANGLRWIDPTTNNPVGVFETMATLGTNGSPDEKGRANVYTALETLQDDPQSNIGFERDDAYLSIIMISDEDDSSGQTPIALTPFETWLQNKKPVAGMATFSSIVGPRGGCATADAGTQYLDVTEAVGGIEWSICNPNWDTVLQQLGMQAAGLKREFFLSQLPVESTIHVWVDDPSNDGNAWTYDRARNSVTFTDFVPDPLSDVHIDYALLSAWSEGGDTDTDAP